jgi:hypothetical protein
MLAFTESMAEDAGLVTEVFPIRLYTEVNPLVFLFPALPAWLSSLTEPIRNSTVAMISFPSLPC